ncbi:DUF4286 family protein [Patiriisocius sp. Uisw_017]|jgi:hypothetical protein|uniref:DUF4286 family protein n=1 Tax=Patiriisocius sp. Uisw_017 TaxID=3230968 RepID=UPI0039ECE38B
MYIYNVTINIENSVHDKWLEWMKTQHIPAMLDTRKFTKALMTKVQIEEEMGGTTYSVQYHTDSKATLEKYYQEDAESLRAQSNPFEGKFVTFRTELEIICEQ